VHNKRAYSLAFFIMSYVKWSQACKEVTALTSDKACLLGDQIGHQMSNFLWLALTWYRCRFKQLCADKTKDSGLHVWAEPYIAGTNPFASSIWVLTDEIQIIVDCTATIRSRNLRM
jgi:hypothetical protein